MAYMPILGESVNTGVENLSRGHSSRVRYVSLGRLTRRESVIKSLDRAAKLGC